MRKAVFQIVSPIWDDMTILDAIGLKKTDLETQRRLYVELGNYLTKVFSTTPNQALQSALTSRLRTVKAHFARAERETSEIVRSPIIATGTNSSWIEWIQGLETDEPLSEINTALAVSFLVETSASGVQDDPIPTMSNSSLISEISSYWAWKTAGRLPAEASSQLNRIISEADTRMGVLETHATEFEMKIVSATLRSETAFFDLQSDIERKVGYLEERHRDLGKNIQNQEQALAQNQAFTQSVEKNFAAFADAVREELKINTAKRLWDARSTANQRAFTWSAAVAVLLIIIPIVAAYIYRDGIISYLHVIETPVAQVAPATTEPTNVTASNTGLSPASLTVITIGRLLTVTIPIALWFWLIRLVVRYNYRSMVLADDARQRSTMMDTYFHLIEHQAASVDDRALILAALFRPAPGHGPDNVEPPDFTDFINKMKA